MAWFPWRRERKERKEEGPLPSSAPQGSDQRHRVLSGLVSALKHTMSCLLFLCAWRPFNCQTWRWLGGVRDGGGGGGLEQYQVNQGVSRGKLIIDGAFGACFGTSA